MYFFQPSFFFFDFDRVTGVKINIKLLDEYMTLTNKHIQVSLMCHVFKSISHEKSEPFARTIWSTEVFREEVSNSTPGPYFRGRAHIFTVMNNYFLIG